MFKIYQFLPGYYEKTKYEKESISILVSKNQNQPFNYISGV